MMMVQSGFLHFHIAFPADIVFIVKDKPHPIFERDADDLVYTATVPLGKVISFTPHLSSVGAELGYGATTQDPVIFF